MTDFSAKNCLWADRRKEEVASLVKLVPWTGEITGKENKALELYRGFSNAYYDLYNNGGGNWKLRGQGYRNAAKAYGVTKELLSDMRCQVTNRGYCRELEILGDLVIDAALAEQAEKISSGWVAGDEVKVS